MKGNRADAEEAFSRAGLAAFQSYSQALKPRAWLFRITYNCCIDIHRERQRRAEDSFEHIGEECLDLDDAGRRRLATPSPEEQFLIAERKALVRRLIEALPTSLKEVLIRRLAGESFRHIADAVGTSEANVRKRAQLARRRLQQSMGHLQANSGLKSWPCSRPEDSVEASSAEPCPLPEVLDVACVTAAGSVSTAERLLFLGYRAAAPSAKRLESLRLYVRRHPSGWKKRWLLSRELVAAGAFGEAVDHYRALAAKRPRHVDIGLERIELLRT
ncbi:MAG: sigma-70 family RNA polymerase sigma factor, partial [Acidobacteriota bacterium]